MANRDNTHLVDKVQLRLSMLPESGELSVLDAYHGYGEVWNNIRYKRPNLDISLVGIDKRSTLPGTIKMDNLRALKTLDLNRFDVIDLDAYGVPFDQIEILFNRKYAGIVFFTFIQVLAGALPFGILRALGYTDKMIKSIPMMLSRNGFDKWCEYLAMRGVRSLISYRFNPSINRYTYGGFVMGD